MQIIGMQLEKFFLDHRHYRLNGVEIIYSIDKSIQVCSKVPELVRKKEVTVDLVSGRNDLCNFIYEYLITSPDDLTSITAEQMLKRFTVGRRRKNMEKEYCLG